MASESKMQPGMIAPRKRMAMDKGAGSMGADTFPPGKGGPMVSPMGSSELGDSARGAGPGVGGGKGRHGMQAAPDHGTMTDHFNRDGKV